MYNGKEITTIIQARLGSTRLPNKVLLPLANRSVIEWVFHRSCYSRYTDRTIVAIPDNEENSHLADFLYNKNMNFITWKGDEDDVMSRVIAAASITKTDIIVDITADCPMVDPWHIDYMIKLKEDNHIEYISNCVMRTWPDGLDIQIYDLNTLRSVKKIFKPKNHVGWNIAQHPTFFSVFNLSAPDEYYWPELGLTLDTEDDYTLLSHIFKIFKKDIYFRVEDIIRYIKKNLPLADINKHIIRKKPEEG